MDEVALFLETYDYLRTEFEVMFEWFPHEKVPWNELDITRLYKAFDLKYILQVKKGGRTIRLLWPRVDYYYSGGRRGDHIAREYQAWGQVTFQGSIAHCLIRTKTMEDRVQNLFINEPRTGYKDFDKAFQLSTETGCLENFNLSDSQLSRILELDLDDIDIEIKDQKLIISTHRIVDKELCMKIARFLFAIKD